VAEHKDYGLAGSGRSLQLGKQGPKLVGNADTSVFVFTSEDGTTLTRAQGANATTASDLVTKAQLDAIGDSILSDGFNLQLGDISSEGDASWTDGAVQTLTNTTTVSEGLDKINEALENVRNNTFVKSVDFSTNVTSGGNPLSVTLSTSVVGSANRYTIAWGDGQTTTATSDSTPSHTYTDNTNSPYSVTVTAFNVSGSGEGSTASTTKDNFITLYTATPVADFDLYAASSGGSALTGNNRHIDAGETIYIENTTSNSSTATCTYEISWGDGSANTSVASGEAGDVGQSRVSHTYSADSGFSSYTITMQQTAHNTADPGEVGSTTSDSIKVYDPAEAAPNNLSTKTLVLDESSSGSSPKLAVGFTQNFNASSSSAGDTVTRITSSSGGTYIEASADDSYSYDGDDGDIKVFDGDTEAGSLTLATAGDGDTDANVQLINKSDYNLLTSSGSSTSFSNSIYTPNLYKGFKPRARFTNSQVVTGVHEIKLRHDFDGSQHSTNTVKFVKDDMTSSPSISTTGATLVESSAGTLAYESGIPYYTNNASLTLSGLTVQNLTGQTYKNTSTPVDLTNGTNFEGTSGRTVNNQGYSYAQIDGTSSMLTGSIPNINVGVSSAYSLGDLSVSVNGGQTGVEQIKVRVENVNGTSSYSEITDKKIQTKNSSSGVSEIIPVADSLGATHDDDGKRITGFGGSDDTPTFSSSTNYYTANAWSGAVTVAGTSEAITRFGDLAHFNTDLSTGYLPVGPDLSGRTGDQYFTFAFRRTTMANFDITLSGSISGLWVAAPGTDIDDTSTINGWIDSSITYGGAGTPGADTGAGGNGSNGCAFTSGDRIPTSGSSSGTYTMTLGDQNGTGATGNNILVRIKLESGDSLTAVSIS